MKDNFFAYCLAGLLLISSVAASVMTTRHYYTIREIAKLQYELARINHQRQMLQSLAAYCLAYSKQNPAILPILERYDIKGQTGPSTNTLSNSDAINP